MSKSCLYLCFVFGLWSYGEIFTGTHDMRVKRTLIKRNTKTIYYCQQYFCQQLYHLSFKTFTVFPLHMTPIFIEMKLETSWQNLAVRVTNFTISSYKTMRNDQNSSKKYCTYPTPCQTNVFINLFWQSPPFIFNLL